MHSRFHDRQFSHNTNSLFFERWMNPVFRFGISNIYYMSTTIYNYFQIHRPLLIFCTRIWRVIQVLPQKGA